MSVRKLRLRRGWTQDQLAEIAGLSVRTVQRLERGGAPSLETAKALASVFEVDLETFRPEDVMSDPHEPRTTDSAAPDELAALAYAKSVKEFWQGVVLSLVMAAIFFAAFGPQLVVLLVFGGVAIGLIAQGLLTFEIVRLPGVDWERRIAERRLGRRL